MEVDLRDFKPIPGFDNKYYINRKGDIYSLKSNQFLSPSVKNSAYGYGEKLKYITLYHQYCGRVTYTVKRLIYETFYKRKKDNYYRYCSRKYISWGCGINVFSEEEDDG